MPILGAHVSASGGLPQAIINAQRIGAQALQVFGSSPRQWGVYTPKANDIEAFIKNLAQAKLGPVFLHAAYMVNLASANAFIYRSSVASLVGHLNIAKNINAQGLIFHPGSGAEPTRDEALKRVVKGMQEVLKKVPGTTQLIVENTAGGGNKVGHILEDLAFFIKKSKNKRIKICIDTAHALEAGLIEKYSPANIKKLLDDFEKLIPINNLVALHCNDSKTPYNSHHDRHENIGQGYIGLDGFKNLSRDKRVNALPWLLEVPGFDEMGPDKKNINILKKCTA